jgi:hypothetical protein
VSVVNIYIYFFAPDMYPIVACANNFYFFVCFCSEIYNVACQYMHFVLL